MKRIKIDESMKEILIQSFFKELTDKMARKEIPAEIKIPINMSVNIEEKVKIIFTKTAYKKMMALIEKCPEEIGWHGLVERTGEKTFEVYDIVVFPQEVTGATVTPDEAEYSQWQCSLTDEQYTNMCFHGHSHVSMGVSPSGTDLEYQRNKVSECSTFYIFGIFNKRKENWLNIYDIESNVLYEDKDIELMTYSEEEEVWAEDQISQYVKKEKIVSQPFIGSYQEEEDGWWEQYCRRFNGKSLKANSKQTKGKSNFPQTWDDIK